MDDAVGEWLASGEEDLATARYNLEGDKTAYAAFLAQQAVEKVLKAFFIAEHGETIQTHNLVRLAEDVEAPARITDICAELNQLYVETRYPDSLTEFSRSETETFIEQADEVVTWTKKQLSE